MRFQIGGYYKHASKQFPCPGKMIHVIGAVWTTLRGFSLIAEQSDDVLLLTVVAGETAGGIWEESDESEWRMCLESGVPERLLDLPVGAKAGKESVGPAKLVAKLEGGQVVISIDSFEHLLNCLDNQKFVGEAPPCGDAAAMDPDDHAEVQRKNQAAIDDFNRQCRELLVGGRGKTSEEAKT